MSDALGRLGAALADHYSIEREIGAGGMATVYLAEDVKHHRKVALKVLRPELAAVLGTERFLSEINVTANLQHPHLLPLFDSGGVDGLLFYVMPYIAGESLRARLERERQLPVDEAVRIATSVASALDYAHRHGVIHRDLKPENILLHDGQPLVTDFGIALAISNAGGARVTQTGLSLGTPQYMSPEQATGDRIIDARSDIYSLAAVLYEMLVGEAPHTGATVQAIIARLLTEAPPSARTQRSAVPPNVDLALQKALAKLPADRFTSAQQFADALNDPRATIVLPSSTLAADVAQPKPRRRRERLRAAAPWTVAAIGLLIAGWAARPNANPPAGANLPTTRFTVTASAGITIETNRTIVIVSPDGRHIAFAGFSAGQRALFVRPIDALEAWRVEGTEDFAGLPFFSPDGAWLVFGDGSRLIKVPVAGGAAVPLTDLEGGTRGDWGPDNRIVLGGSGTLPHAGLMLLDAAGGTPVPLTHPDTARGERFLNVPSFLPGGDAVLFAINRGPDMDPEIALVTLEGEVTRLGTARGGRPIYVESGHIITLSARDNAVYATPFDLRRRRFTGSTVVLLDGVAVRQFGGAGILQADISQNGTLAYIAGENVSSPVLVDRRGAVQPLLDEPRRYRRMRIAPDGQRILVEVISGGGAQDPRELWLLDRRHDTFSRFTFAGGQDPVWTPDGSRVAFAVFDSVPQADIYWQPADGTGTAEPLLRAPGMQFPIAFTPDGKSLIYDENRGPPNGTDIRALHIGTDSSTAFLATPFTERLPALSPDGRWLAYASNESETTQIYVRPFPGPGPKIPISIGLGEEPAWSPNGREIFYRDGVHLIAAEVRTTPEFSIVARRPLFEDRFVRGGTLNYDVFPDGEHFVMLQVTNPDERFIVVTNWLDEIRRRSGASR